MSLFRGISCWMTGNQNLQKQCTNKIISEKSYISKISLPKNRRERRKRANLQPTQNEAPSCASLSLGASYTVEAAVVLPLFLGVLVLLLFFFRVMSVQWGIQRALEDTGRLLAVTAESGLDESSEKEKQNLAGAAAAGVLLGVREYDVPVSYIRGGILGIDLSDSVLEGNYVDLRARYTVEFPLKFFGNLQWQISQSARNRKWVGYDPAEDRWDGRYVYVTAYGSVFHTTVSCSYLNPSVHGVDISEVDARRNQDGSRYQECRECAHRTGTGSCVYITDYGTAYHRTLECGGLKRTVYRVAYEDAKGYAPCTKCAGGSREM